MSESLTSKSIQLFKIDLSFLYFINEFCRLIQEISIFATDNFRNAFVKTLSINKTKFLFFIILFIFSGFIASISQTSDKIDSLELILKKSNRQKKIEILNQLADIYLNKSKSKSIEYAKNALSLANSIHDLKGSAEALNNLGSAFYVTGNFNEAINYYKKSLEIYSRSGDKKNLARPLNNLGMTYYKLKEYERSLEYYKKALDIQKSEGTNKDLGDLLHNIGLLFRASGNFEAALENFKESLKYRLKSRIKDDIIESYNALAMTYKTIGNYDYVIKYSLKSLSITEEIGKVEGIISALNKVGNIYYQIGNYQKALEFYHKSLKLSNEIRDTAYQAGVLNNIGIIYYDMKSLDSALIYYHKSLELAEKKQNVRGMARLYNNIGLVYMEQNEFNKALEYCKKSLDIKEKVGDKKLIFSSLTSIGQIYNKLNKHSEALKYAKEGLELAKEAGNKELFRDSYQLLYEIYFAMGNYKNALDAHKEFTAIKDSLLNEQSRNEITAMEVKYETEKKEKENEMLKRENEIQRRYFAIVTGLVFVLVLVVYSRYRTKRKANIMLTEKNKQIERANVDLSVKNLQITAQKEELSQMYEELRRSEIKLREANATKDKFFSIIAHDLKTPIQGMIMTSYILANHYNKMSELRIEDFLKKLNQSSNQLANLLENLLQWARSQSGRMEFNPEVFDINLIVENNIKVFQENANRKNISLTSSIESSTFVYSDQNMISAVVRNLISNSIKFTRIGGNIHIKSNLNDGFLEICVEDNGIGISEEDIEKLFRIDVHHTIIGTSKEKGTGLGLILSKEFVEKNGGKIWVESELNHGSKFKFTVPLAEIKNSIPTTPTTMALSNK